MCRVENIDSFFLKTFKDILLSCWIPPNAVSDVKGKCFCPACVWREQNWSVCQTEFTVREKWVSSPLHTLQPQSTWVIAFTQGDCGVCKLAWFPFGPKLLQKSLSHHYFWVGELDQGQLYPVCIIVCLAYIPNTRWDFNKVIFLKRPLSNLDYFGKTN